MCITGKVLKSKAECTIEQGVRGSFQLYTSGVFEPWVPDFVEIFSGEFSFGKAVFHFEVVVQN